MDTRIKIIGSTRRAQAKACATSQAEARATQNQCEKNICLVTGAFDPLLAEHAKRLKELAEPNQLLVVAITNPPDPLLPQQARAELVAALAVVDYVIIGIDIEEAPVRREFMEQVVCKSRGS
ncbi:MAG: hypothetical protein ACR2NN_03530 [Bryobacteraceae bacterium]